MHRTYIDFSELLVRVENDRELMRELLAIFKEDFPPHYQALRQAVASQDADRVASVAHTLKGMLSNLAAHEAAGVAALLENSGRNGNAKELREILVKFDGIAEGLMKQLEDSLAEVTR